MQKTVNIIGTEYMIEHNLESKEADGEAQFYCKKINIKPTDKMLDEDSTEEEKTNREKEVTRHELWHCLLFECGAEEYAYDEKLIDLLAIQSPKIFKTFQELDIL